MLSTTENLAVDLNKPWRLSFIWDYSEMAQRDCHEDYATKEEAEAAMATLNHYLYNASVRDMTFRPSGPMNALLVKA